MKKSKVSNSKLIIMDVGCARFYLYICFVKLRKECNLLEMSIG